MSVSKIINKKALSVLFCVLMVLTSLPFAVNSALAQENDFPVLKSVNAGNSGIEISWDAFADAENYRVFYKENGESTWHAAGDTTATSFTWAGAKNNTNYTFTVRCVSADGKTFASGFDSIGMTLTPVASPVLSSIAVINGGTMISWNAINGAEAYKVFRKISGGTWSTLTTTTSTSFTDTTAVNGTKYIYTVRCVSADGATYTSGYNANGLSVTSVDTPVLSSVYADNGGVIIKWNSVNNAEKYRVFYKANDESSWHTAGDTTATSFTWAGAKNNTNYTFTFRCVSADGKTFASGFDSIGMTLTPVASPVLSSIAVINGGTMISWNAVNGAEAYKVFRKIPGGTWSTLTTTTSTSFTDTTAVNGTKYIYTVRCVSADGATYTSGYNANGLNVTVVAAPKLSSVYADNGGVIIKWNAVNNAEKYRVFYKANNESFWHTAGDTTAASFTWNGAKNNTNYTFTVRCVSADGKTFASGFDSIGMTLTPVASPVLSSIAVINGGTMISWNAVNGAEAYKVFRKTSGGTWSTLTTTTSTSFTDTTALNGTKYIYTVRCVSADGATYTSGYNANGLSVTAVAVPKLSYVSNTATGVTVSWSKVSGAEKYRVFYKANNENTWHAAGDTTSLSYTWTGAKSNTRYTFTVRCVTSDGKVFASGFDTVGKSITYIAAPKISSVSAIENGIKIAWGSVAGAVKYRVYYKANGESTWHKLADTISTSYVWTNVRGGTQYAFTIRCINADGTSCTSGYDAAGKGIKYIAAPKVSYAVTIATGTLVMWEKSAGAAKYRVYYKANNESTWHVAGDTTSTVYTWTKGKSGTNYTFTVRCITSDGSACTSWYDQKGVAQGTTFTTSKGYKGVVKNGIVYIDGYLIANKTFPLPESYGNGLTSEMQSAFDRMKAGAKKDGITLWIQSGYRSYSTQKRIYNNYVSRDGRAEADTYSARPGYSEHQSGLAADINIVGSAFDGTREQIWLAKNCYKYGFILRYPKGKTNETGYVYESWHFRYVGEDLAKKLYNGGNWITMEDYFGFTSEYC